MAPPDFPQKPLTVLALAAAVAAGCFSSAPPLPDQEAQRQAIRRIAKGHQLAGRGCGQEARDQYAQALTEAQRVDDFAAAVEARLALAELALREGRLAAAAEWASEALAVAQPEAAVEAALRSRRILAAAQPDREDEWLQEALAECRPKAPTACGPVLNALGLREKREGRADSARLRFEEALAAGLRAGDSLGQADSQLNLGLLDQEAGRLEPARRRFQAALALDRQAANTAGLAVDLWRLALLSEAAGEPEAALGYALRALGAWESLGDTASQRAALKRLLETELSGPARRQLQTRLHRLDESPPAPVCR